MVPELGNLCDLEGTVAQGFIVWKSVLITDPTSFFDCQRVHCLALKALMLLQLLQVLTLNSHLRIYWLRLLKVLGTYASGGPPRVLLGRPTYIVVDRRSPLFVRATSAGSIRVLWKLQMVGVLHRVVAESSADLVLLLSHLLNVALLLLD